MSEGHTIRNTIIGTVIGGLILAVLLSPWLRGLILTVLGWGWHGVVFVGGSLFRSIAVPVWLLVIVTVLAMFPIVRAVRAFRRRKGGPSTYTEDSIFGVVWRWRYRSGGVDAKPFCPKCDLELVPLEQRYDSCDAGRVFPADFTHFACENCRIKSEKFDGGVSYALDRVEREIRRRIRTGEWKARTGKTQEAS